MVLRFYAAAAIVVCLFTAGYSLQLIIQNLGFTEAETEVGFWGRGSYHPEDNTVEQTVALIDGLLKSQPNHPDYLALRANVAVWQAYWSSPQDLKSQYAQLSLTTQFHAVQSRPGHRQSWEQLTIYAARAGSSEAIHTQAESQLKLLSLSTPAVMTLPIP